MRIAILAGFAATLLCVGCGSPRSPLLSGGEDPIRGGSAGFQTYSPPIGLRNCLRARGLTVARVDRSTIAIAPASDGLAVTFEAIDEAAWARQLRGLAQGAEMIGSGLVYVGQAGPAKLAQVQDCLG
jgi:hypothetical protein